jgi:hypothetical protein
MGKLCIIMQHTTLCTLCIAFILVSHTCIFAKDHAEQRRAEPPEPAPVESAYYKKTKARPGVSNHNS